MALIRLSQNDWEELLPAKPVTLGTTILTIEPIGAAEIVRLSLKGRAVFSEIRKAGITFENFDEPDNVSLLAELCLKFAPDLMEQATGLHRDDISRLPAGPLVELLRAVVEINIDSQDKLYENIKALGKMILSRMKEEEPTQENETEATE